MAKQIEVLFSSYRKADYADPDGFNTQLGIVLSAYPEAVVMEVTSPLTGIQRKLKFPPSIAEVVEACDEAYAPIRRQEERERIARENARALPAPPPEDRSQRPTRGELEAQGLIRKDITTPLPPADLWRRWCENRKLPGRIGLAEDTRKILEVAGYDINGPDDQVPASKLEAPCIEGEVVPEQPHA